MCAWIGYGQTKWVAEQLVMTAARDHGVPVIIARTGMIGGTAATGVCAPDDLIAAFFHDMLQTGQMPETFFSMTLTPVDYCSLAIAQLATQGDDYYGRTYHTVLPDYIITLHDMSEALSRCGYTQLKSVPFPKWRERVKKDPTMPMWYLLHPISSFADHFDTYFHRANGLNLLEHVKRSMNLPGKEIILELMIADLAKKGVIPPSRAVITECPAAPEPKAQVEAGGKQVMNTNGGTISVQ